MRYNSNKIKAELSQYCQKKKKMLAGERKANHLFHQCTKVQPGCSIQ